MTTSTLCLAVTYRKQKWVGGGLQAVVQTKSENTKKGVLAINLRNQGRAGTRGELKLDWDGVGWREGCTVSCLGCGLRTKINRRNLTFGRRRLPKLIRLTLGEYRMPMVVETETIYAIMQPPLPPASTGMDGTGSPASGMSEVMVKRSAKESIGVIVWCVD
jgi:hypothetical protein